MLSVSILESNRYISFSSHQITTTGIDRKTIEEKRYLQRRRVSQTRGMLNQIERFRRIKKCRKQSSFS